MNLGPMVTEALEVTSLDGQLEAGIASTAHGRARWCSSCDVNRLASDMRWTLDGVYACRWCLGPGVGTPELWTDPTEYETSTGVLVPMLASIPWTTRAYATTASSDPWWPDHGPSWEPDDGPEWREGWEA